MNTVLSWDRSPCFTYTPFSTIPPPTTPCLPVAAFAHYPSALRVTSRLRHSLADSPGHQAESSSSSYGLVIHLPLLSTPSRDGCSYVRLQAGECVPGEDSHLSVHVRLQAHERRHPCRLLRFRTQPRRGVAMPHVNPPSVVGLKLLKSSCNPEATRKDESLQAWQARVA